MKNLFLLFVIALLPMSACSQPDNMAAENKAIINRIIEEMWNNKNPALIDEIYAANYTFESPGGVLHGPDGYREVYATYTNAFPDISFTVEQQVAEGDKVVVTWTLNGTHKGELTGIAPTDKQVTVKGISVFRFAGGKVVEELAIWDTLGLMQQIGAVAEPETTMK